MKHNFLKTLLFIPLIAFFVFSFTRIAQAAQQTDSGYKLLAEIPTFGESVSGITLVDYMKGLFIAVIGLAIILAVVQLIVGGVEYVAAAVPSAKSDAKNRIIGAIGGLLLILIAWILLKALNPGLLSVGFNLEMVGVLDSEDTTATNPNAFCIITIAACTESCGEVYETLEECKSDEEIAYTLGTRYCADVGKDDTDERCISKTCGFPSHTEPEKCKDTSGGPCEAMTTGLCAVDNLKGYFSGSEGEKIEKATKASKVCRGESGGDPGSESLTDRCQHTSPTFSWGLFQFNLTVHDFPGVKCAWNGSPRAFDAKNYACTKTESNYSACKAEAINPEVAIKKMVSDSNNGTNFSPEWSAATACGIE